MKRKVLNLGVTVAFTMALASLANCGSVAAKNNNEPQISMSASGDIRKIRMVIAGTGIVTIYWGDNQTKRLSLTVQGDFVEHDYATNVAARVVKIVGANVTALFCEDNDLTELDVSQSPYLTVLECRRNRLERLDVNRNYALKELGCDENRISSLDLSRNSELQSLSCAANNLSAPALNAMFQSLHKNAPQGQTKDLNIRHNPGEDACKKTIATDKGWTVN
ncbi:MAG: hypothetical protein LBD59_09570 [Prevotellaceae bacterium]|jgi:Leucine-rich repeat (LRR) protein|nr:hypothetical protein [Prevotellaceae bacterium]